jgi:hypothetical protein
LSYLYKILYKLLYKNLYKEGVDKMLYGKPFVMDNKKFAKWLEDKLIRRCLTQVEFAALIGVDEQRISECVNGFKPVTEDFFTLVCKGLNVSRLGALREVQKVRV